MEVSEMSSLEDLELKDKRVLVRADFNASR